MLEWREVPPTAGLPLQRRDFIGRADAPPLEEFLAEWLCVPWARLECSGTSALVIALTTLAQASTRRKVIIPGYTCPLVALAVLHCGLVPVVCDVAPGTFDYCLETLAHLCDRETLAVIATHLGGRVADLETICAVARREGAFVIEDAAQSLGAKWHGQNAGTVGDIGFFSLAAGKGLTLYEGGVLVARDPEMRRLLQATSERIAPYRMLCELRRSLELIAYGFSYRPNLLRLVYGMPLRRALRRGRLVAAVGDEFSSSIPIHRVGAFRRGVGARAAVRLPAFLETISAQADPRRKTLESIDGVTVIGDAEGSQGTWPFFMVLMPSESARDRALDRLWRAGLGVTRLFVHALPDYRYLSRQLGACEVPNARDFAARMLTVSNSPWLRDGDFERICAELAVAIRDSGQH
jgi:dTDP-4-amino-4,6-dideoxygalactose transaminase